MKISNALFRGLTRLQKFASVSGCRRIVCLTVIASMGLAGYRVAADETNAAPRYNAGGHVSLSLINLVLERQILEKQTVSDEIAGARTRAETTTRGRLRAEFIPSNDRAVVDFRMIGELSAPNATATKGSVTVRMTSQTSIDARKRVVITGAGLFPAASQADCNTETEILDVEASRRVMERLGRRRAEKMRPEAQQNTSQQVAERVEAELDKQANDPLTGANQFYADKIRLPLVNAGSFPRDLRLSTTDTHLAIRVLAQKKGQDEAPARMPRLNPQFDIHVCGHQSMVANMSEPLVGGKTFDDKQFLDVMKIMTGTAQRGLWVFDGRDRWNVTFTKQRPIQAVFANGTFRLTYNFQAATCGDDTVQGAIEATALYRPMMSAEGVYLVRESSPMVRYTDGLPDDDARARVLQQLSQRFGAFFQESIHFDGLSPPAGGTYAKLRELKIVELKCEDGWFTIGYELNRPSKVAIQP
ncbi:MAG: hypothetical protein K8T91_06980 [Planctomycetes bacterium]|nr:hypothetical protein [Planctomycetota bacterium]